MRSRIRLTGWRLLVLLPCLFAAGPCWAEDRIEPSVAPKMPEHTRHFEKKVYKVEGEPELVPGFFDSVDNPGYPIRLTLR